MPLTLAVDFDGTLVENRFPGVGPPVPGAVQTLRAAAARGDRVILWTCRTGRTLQDAVAWCRKQGIKLHGINADPKHKGGPKVHADVYIDERGITPTVPDRMGKPRVDWTKVRPALMGMAAPKPAAKPTRLILVGPPRAGKSTQARALRAKGVPTFCTDPRSKVQEPEEGVTYLPEGLDWDAASKYVVDNWLSRPGSWCIEGVATVHALRHAVASPTKALRGCTVMKFTDQYEHAVTKDGQRAMAKAVETVWNETAPHLSTHGVAVRKP